MMLVLDFQHYRFSPSLVPTLVTIALTYTMISLGLWQLDRAEFKLNLQRIIENKEHLEHSPLRIQQLAQDNELYSPVLASGQLDHRYTILLDNQVYNTQAGYSIYTPMLLENGSAVLVNRGWVSHNGNRSVLPDLSLSQAELNTTQAHITKFPSRGLVLSDNANDYTHWPAIVQYMDINEIQNHLPYTLTENSLTLDNAQSDHIKVIPVSMNMNSDKHTAYAVQWFALTTALLIIYITVNLKKKEVSDHDRTDKYKN